MLVDTNFPVDSIQFPTTTEIEQVMMVTAMATRELMPSIQHITNSIVLFLWKSSNYNKSNE